MLDALERWAAVGRAAADAAVLAPEPLHLLERLPGDALDGRPERLERAGPARRDARRRPGSRARPRPAWASSGPGSARTRRRASRARRRAAGRARRASRARAARRRCRGGRRGALGELREALGDQAERVPVGARLPRRRDRRVERVHERVQVGRGEVVLLVPGGGRQHDVREERVRGHAEVDGGEQVELRLGRITPGDVARPLLRGGLLGAHAGLGRAEHVLAGSTRGPSPTSRAGSPPDREHARDGCPARRGPRTRSAAVPRAAPRRRARAGSTPAASASSTRSRRVAVEARERRQPAQPRRRGVHVGDVAVAEQAACPAARRAPRAGRPRSATGP